MKGTAFLLNGFTNVIKSRFTVIMLTLALTSPSFSSAQSNPEDEVDPVPVETPTTSTGPWNNSAGSSVGTRNTNGTSGTATTPRLGPGGGQLGRPAAGATPDATGGPGGNPDVPFDTTMNIMFLVTGVAFAYGIYRRRLKVKTVPVQNK